MMVFGAKVKFPREHVGKTFCRRVRSHTVPHALRCT